jgi:hypothetical protein
VCPDPKNIETCKLIEENYSQGHYAECKMYLISEDDYNNDENWN